MDKKLRKNNRKLILVLVLVLGLSIGYAFLSTNVSIFGDTLVKKNTWDVHFENIVDDNEGATVNTPATISEDKLTVTANIDLNVPGDEYYFYVDVVNNGTIDAMLDKLEVTGLEEADYIDFKVTYSDGIEIKQSDILKANSSDTLLVKATFKKDITNEQLPSEDRTLTTNITIDYVQADESANERETVEDTKAPTVKFTKTNEVILKNDWYQSLTVVTKAMDGSKVKGIKYCLTKEQNCTPMTSVELVNNSFSVDITDPGSYKMCVEATDTKDNSEVVCSNERYNVDIDNPTMNSVSVTPDDNTMTVSVNATDAGSGAGTYYYSKDAGANYITSKNPSYTFTSLDEGDYLVTAYVEDLAGHTSEMKSTQTTIRNKSWCETNGITNFGDCVVATEAKNSNVAQAKTTISAKGSPNFTATVPAIKYSEVHALDISIYESTAYQRIGNGYTYNPVTGYYTVTGGNMVDLTTIDYSNGDYYTCTGLSTSCPTMYKINSVEASTNDDGTIKYRMIKNNYTSAVRSYENNESGMYAANDDEGTSYYYRGAVSGNYVKFAGKYWRIIRVNGDGSVRLIYDGTSIHSNGEASSNRQIEAKSFNTWHSDNAYVGYMYGNTNTNVVKEYDVAYTQAGLSPTAKYWFGTEYVPNGADKNTFSIGGTKYQLTLAEYNESHSTERLYTCLSTSETETCQKLKHVQRYVSPTSISVTAIEYGSVSREAAETNTKDSGMKSYLDSWYVSNLQSYASKIFTNASFCGDRETSTYQSEAYKNTGYGATPTMYGQERFASWSGNAPKGPRLTCSKTNDKYTVSSASTGNKALENPIGLITADEVNMAGGTDSTPNLLYYLYSGTDYWTMSPSSFGYDGHANIMGVNSSGAIRHYRTNGGSGIRPIVNLKSDGLTFTGSGTKEDPYVIQ